MAEAYAWIEEGGVWRRKLGSMESFYLTLASPEGEAVHWMIGCCISIKYRGNDSIDIENAIRQAWKTTRHGFPNIAAVIDPSAQEMVFGPDDPTAVDEWSLKSFKTHDGITADELFSSFKSQFSMTLHFLRDTNELIIQAPHALIDGRGILYLYHALFTALSRKPEDHANGNLEKTGPPNLTKPYDEWLGLSAQPSDKNIKDAESIFQCFAQEKPILLPGVDFGRKPQKAIHRELALSEESTRAIIDACKRKGITVTTAWHAALAMAVQKIQSTTSDPGTSYTQFTTIDLRRYFPAPFSAPTHSIGSLQTALPFPIPVPSSPSSTTTTTTTTFTAITTSLSPSYRAPFAFASNDFGYLAPYMAASKKIIASGAVPPSSTPYLSSMGVVEDFLGRRYGDWELGAFWISSTMLTGELQVYLWTWRGQMMFSACYNEAFYAARDVEAVLVGTREILVRVHCVV